MTDVRAPVQRVLAAAASSYGQHLQLSGPLPELPAERIRRLVEDSGLTGRGGAGFPTGRKLAAVAGRRRAVVVANGAEGEPASSKDRMLLLRAPHLVLDGVALAVRATGATEAHLYAPDDLVDRLLGIARERPDPIAVSLIRAPHTFIAGQETAAIAAVEGRPALPRTDAADALRQRRARPADPGAERRDARPARADRPVRTGLVPGDRTAGEPGTRLLTVSGAVFRPGVYEAAAGDTLGAALRLAGGTAGPVQAVLVGGYHGGWVPWLPDTAGLPLTGTALTRYDAAPGAGVLVALPRRRCGLAAAAEIVAYLAGQNAGQCGPCRNGLPELAGNLRELATGWPTKALVREIRRLAGLVDGRGACAHPTGTVRLVRSTLRVFGPDVELHLAGRCAAMRGAR